MLFSRILHIGIFENIGKMPITAAFKTSTSSPPELELCVTCSSPSELELCVTCSYTIMQGNRRVKRINLTGLFIAEVCCA
jgi:hypothetical protein